jgi:hypothetical protein
MVTHLVIRPNWSLKLMSILHFSLRGELSLYEIVNQIRNGPRTT